MAPPQGGQQSLPPIGQHRRAHPKQASPVEERDTPRRGITRTPLHTPPHLDGKEHLPDKGEATHPRGHKTPNTKTLVAARPPFGRKSRHPSQTTTTTRQTHPPTNKPSHLNTPPPAQQPTPKPTPQPPTPNPPATADAKRRRPRKARCRSWASQDPRKQRFRRGPSGRAGAHPRRTDPQPKVVHNPQGCHPR